MKPAEGTPDQIALIALLEEAGATLLALPNAGPTTAVKISALPVLRDAAEAYGWSAPTLRPPMPSAARISRMDTVLGYLGLIAQDKYMLRRVVGCRALVHPLTGRHLYSWRRLGGVLGADPRAVQRWHADGIRLILCGLRQRAADASEPKAASPRP